MPQYPLRANLNNPNFPFATELWGRSIIVPQFDQNFDRTTLNAPGTVIDKGIPQAFYMHNVVPTAAGYQSIGYFPIKQSGIFPAAADQAFTLIQADGSRVIWVPAGGQNYFFDGTSQSWLKGTTTPGANASTLVSTATVQGITYAFYSQIGAFRYDNTTKDFVPVTLTGLDISKVLGIVGANGYLIAWTADNVAWSSLLTPTDFTPDLTTGAGGGAINDANGNIKFCLSISGGFIAYCDFNAVGARYSGNINFPFIFKEVAGSAGVQHPNDVSYHSNLAFHILWGGNGLQQLTLTTTTQIYAEASDFLASHIFEDFDEATDAFNVDYLTTPVILHLTIISARFLIISYGPDPTMFKYALIYDLTINRWGKLKVDHVHCFEYSFPTFDGSVKYQDLSATTYAQLSSVRYQDLGVQLSIPPSDQFRHNVAFLQGDGTIQIVDFSYGENTANGVLMLGKYQFQRVQRIEHQIAEFDVVRSDFNNFSYTIVPTQDGKTLGRPINAFKFKQAPQTIIFKKIVNAYSLVAVLKGQFNLTSATFVFTMGGYTT